MEKTQSPVNQPVPGQPQQPPSNPPLENIPADPPHTWKNILSLLFVTGFILCSFWAALYFRSYLGF